ncbi:MAG: hypothetical protein ACI4HI_15920 [Lachnospiraceae bacterium]
MNNRKKFPKRKKQKRKIKKQQKANATPDYDRYAKNLNIADQSEYHTVSPWGSVYFESFRPDATIDPKGDASFTITHGSAKPIVLEGMTKDNEREDQTFQSVDAFAFRDLNADGFDDIITLCSYIPQGSTDSFREVRLYSGSPSGEYTLQKDLSADTTKALTNPVIADVEQYVKDGHNQFVVSDAAPLKEASNTNETKAANDGWREAYIKYYEENQESYAESFTGATLLHITDDGIPQLALIGDCEAAGCTILTYFNGTVSAQQTARLGFSYIPNSNLWCNSDGHMGYYYDEVYQIQDGQFLSRGNGGYEDPNGVPQTDAQGNPIYEYSWNQKPVSKEQYDRELNAVYDTSRSVDGYDYDNLIPMDQLKETLRTVTP